MNKAIFLDRDGVVNKFLYEPDGNIMSPSTIEQVEILPKVLEGIKKMSMDYYSIPRVIKRSFSDTGYSPYRVFVKLLRNFSVRKFYMTEKLTI